MIALLCVAGAVATFVAWRIVVVRHASVWGVMAVVTGTLGLLSLATGRLDIVGHVGAAWAVGVGVAGGLGLYGATAIFVLIVRRWPAMDRQVAEIYDLRKGLRLATALLLVAGVYAPGEELFWRGLVQGAIGGALTPAAGAALSWLAYIVVNAASGSLAIAAGAVVAGAIWTLLAFWSGGVLASILCHGIWTGLMLAFPPGGARRRTDPRTAPEHP
jgi:membrane protease YdiL (CAAX protease family)